MMNSTYTPPKNAGGGYCYAVGCTNSYRKLSKWYNETCPQHGGYQGGPGCTCKEPFE